MSTHWGRVTQMCVNDLTSIDWFRKWLGADQFIRTNAGILVIKPLGTNFSDFLVEILIISFKKIRLKVSLRKGDHFTLGLNELNNHLSGYPIILPTVHCAIELCESVQEFPILWLITIISTPCEFDQAPLLSNQIILIRGSRINFETLCSRQFCP